MSEQRKIFINGQIITPTEVLDTGFYLMVKGSKIEHLGFMNASSFPADAEIIDVSGQYISPGFIDVHVHGCMNYKSADASREALEAMGKCYAAHGVTGYLPTVHADTEILKKLANLFDEGLPGTKPLGIHIEGPYLCMEKRGAQYPEHIWKCAPETLQSLIDASSGYLKQMTIAPEIDGAIPLIEMLVKRNIIASMGHTDATYEQAMAGVNAGVSHATHTFNAMSVLSHRHPGTVGAALACDSVAAEIITDGVHVHPEVVKILVRAKPLRKVIPITDAIQTAGLPDGEYVQDAKLGYTLNVRNGETYLNNTNTLAGSTLLMNNGINNLMKFAGLDMVEAIHCASLNPAIELGLEHRKGTLEVGKDADIVLFDEDFKVQYTMVEGKVQFQA